MPFDSYFQRSGGHATAPQIKELLSSVAQVCNLRLNLISLVAQVSNLRLNLLFLVAQVCNLRLNHSH